MRFIFYHPRSTDFEEKIEGLWTGYLVRFFFFSPRGERETQVSSHLPLRANFHHERHLGTRQGWAFFLCYFRHSTGFTRMVSFICPRGQVTENRTLKLKSFLMNIKSSKRLPRYMNWCVQLFFVHFHCYVHCVFIITCANHCYGNHNIFVFCLPTSLGYVFIFINFAPRHEKPRKANRGETFTGKIIASKFSKKKRFFWALTKPASEAIHFLTSDWSESSGHSEAEWWNAFGNWLVSAQGSSPL